MKEEDIRAKIDFVISHLDDHKRITECAYQVRNYLVDWGIKRKISESEMYKITSTLRPQSRGAIWEKYFIEKHGCERVPKDANAGDFKKEGKHYEYKASGFNQDGNLHIVQVRPWQNCDYIIQSISFGGVKTFLLSRGEMKEETKLCNAASAHGTKVANEENLNKELRFTVKKDKEAWQRWCTNYRVDENEPFNKDLGNTER